MHGKLWRIIAMVQSSKKGSFVTRDINRIDADFLHVTSFLKIVKLTKEHSQSPSVVVVNQLFYM